MRRIPVPLALVLVLSPALGGSDTPAPPPRDVGLVEKTEVKLTVIDVVVVDRDGRTVPGLALEDFEVEADGRTSAPDTLDVLCPGGDSADPRAVNKASDRPLPAGGGTRRIVLAVDYLHLGGIPLVEALEKSKAFVRARRGSGDEFLVAALTGGIRIEQPFTGDTDRTVQALDRMEDDVTLWNGFFQHTTEFGLFRGLDALLELLSLVDGPKGLALYSSGDGPDPLAYDLEFRNVAAVAAASRVAVYPVDAVGLGGSCPT